MINQALENSFLKNRIQNLKDSLARTELDGYIVANDASMLYFTESIGAAGLWVPLDGECTLYSYGVNYESVKSTTKNSQVELLKRNENPFEKITEYYLTR